MNPPRTLSALRAAVARVLTARGEASDTVWVARDQCGVSLGTTVCGCAVEWIYVPAPTLRVAVAEAWREIVTAIYRERYYSARSAAACRSPNTRRQACIRLHRAQAAVRSIEGDR